MEIQWKSNGSSMGKGSLVSLWVVFPCLMTADTTLNHQQPVDKNNLLQSWKCSNFVYISLFVIEHLIKNSKSCFE